MSESSVNSERGFQASVPELSGSTNEDQKYRADAESPTKVGRLPVMEVFGPTIQGEGNMIGKKTMFIRFGGCDFRCAKCDSLHAVIPQSVKAHANWQTPEEIIRDVLTMAATTGVEWVTLSGGNPAMWEEIGLVVKLFKDLGWKVAVETQGTIWQDWLLLCDVVTISPKGPGMGERFDPAKFEYMVDRITSVDWGATVAVKIVVFDQRDFEFAIGVDEILEKYPVERYLSLGNPYPPAMAPDLTMHDPERLLDDMVYEETKHSMSDLLLQRYKALLDDYLPDWRLSKWVFLPQLHVLVWHNKAKV